MMPRQPKRSPRPSLETCNPGFSMNWGWCETWHVLTIEIFQANRWEASNQIQTNSDLFKAAGLFSIWAGLDPNLPAWLSRHAMSRLGLGSLKSLNQSSTTNSFKKRSISCFTVNIVMMICLVLLPYVTLRSRFQDFLFLLIIGKVPDENVLHHNYLCSRFLQKRKNRSNIRVGSSNYAY
jgi:hypothetical protein